MSDKIQKILVVDDESDILELLQYNLQKEGYQVKTAINGEKAMVVAEKFIPDLILLDIMMPKQDGVETCRQIRESSKLTETFVIFLTARSEEYSEVAAFDMGADDYITKPIKPRALISRINALFRRETKAKKKTEFIQSGELIVDKSSYTATIDRKKISLPKKEFELLYFLVKNPGKVYSRNEILNHIWGTDVYVMARTVDVHIRKVREKIGDNRIVTVKGVGYKFDSESE